MQTAFLALGANLGDRLAALRGARDLLRRMSGMKVMGSSPLYETEPEGGPAGQPPYLNAVLEVRTALSPRDLLHHCLSVEESFGRCREERWGARTLDVDLLFFAAEIRRAPDLTLPHPRLHERLFVLKPLGDLAPDLRHPLLDRTVRQLKDVLPEKGVRLISPRW